MSVRHERLIIIGSGPAGYTAAIYAARAMLKPLMIEGIQPGGQLTITTDVENYPGFADVIQGPWLMEQMRAQALHVGTEIISEHIAEVNFSRRPFHLKADSGAEFTADTVVIATGAQARWLGLPSEAKFQGYGVSACATCDGFFCRNKACDGDRRRQYGRRGGALPHQSRPQGHAGASPGRAARRAHPAAAALRA